MSLTILPALFAVTLFLCMAVLLHLTRKKLIEEPLQQARARRSPIAAFVDDLQHHRWIVIIGLALLVALDKHFGFSGGLLQSRLVLAILITSIFLGRLLLRRSQAAPPPTAGSPNLNH
ncbi:hypothetical protein [Paludibaculum fermentans]|uniref:Uncharacterized protein n=1 Tax=Paludibaculum fermentans TaxID=1473598 RepID=A0A7S7NWX6_PALFE|nr:hypothetical protein [Paludibaculum fermentans]QOY91275.1 hypothetical protein IRI77_15400 [Paludibaculum fermentans]